MQRKEKMDIFLVGFCVIVVFVVFVVVSPHELYLVITGIMSIVVCALILGNGEAFLQNVAPDFFPGLHRIITAISAIVMLFILLTFFIFLKDLVTKDKNKCFLNWED